MNCHSGNCEFLHEIAEEGGRNVLMLVDGSLAFGRLGCFGDCKLNILPPVNISGLSTAVYRPAASVSSAADIVANEIIIDGECIAQVIVGPFTTLPFPLSAQPVVQTVYYAHVHGSHGLNCFTLEHLLKELGELEGADLGIRTAGGWVTGGRLGDIEDCTVSLSAATGSAPPTIITGALTIAGPVPPTIILVGPFMAMINALTVTEIIL